MPGGLWFVIIGALFVAMALSGTVLKRLPLTTALIYLACGFGLGPSGLGLLSFDPLRQAPSSSASPRSRSSSRSSPRA
jgi:sodium/hydrogen antiporter